MEREELIQLVLKRLNDCAESIREQWANPSATPTRHFIIDDLLPAEVAKEIYESFPKDGNGFFTRESFREKKRTSAHLSQHAQLLGDMTYAIQDARTVQKVSELVGMTDLEPDPSLYAGGLSMMFHGDFLNPHIDNSHDGKRDRFRRLNLLYYVSPDWQLENGGNFELWDEECQTPKTIVSQFNRLVVMETNKLSWHSVSPVTAHTPRCCVSNYFFSVNSPDSTDYFHVTSFTGRPEEFSKRVLGVIDNTLRNTVSRVLKIGRGKDQTNKSS